jgi:radical SAM superfamily enzyme YgiQ (UPF0313 family)
MKRFKKVLLVNPPDTYQGGLPQSPLGLLYLAAYLRSRGRGLKVSMVDGAVEGRDEVVKMIRRFRPDLVGVSAMTPNRHKALWVARKSKALIPKCKVVFGGIHPTMMWKQLMEEYFEVDYVVRGEGEVVLYELVRGEELSEIAGLVWRKNGKTVMSNPNQKFIKDLNKLPFPAWDLVDVGKYPAIGKGVVRGVELEKEVRFPLIFSRGCMAYCTFCSSWKVWRGYRFRKGRKVVDEVEMLVYKYKARHLCFYDDTLTGSKEEIINFCKEIIKRKIRVAFVGSTRVNLVDKELLSWMKRAGFYELSFGIESGSPAMLLKINKKTDLKMIKKAVKLTKEAGMRAIALMMYGLPRETEEDRKLTEKLLDDINPDGVGTLGEVWLFPGTPLYEQAKHSGIIDDNFWLGKKPYYIYRGGIGDDPIQWKLKVEDLLKYYLADTWLNRARLQLLGTKNKLLEK